MHHSSHLERSIHNAPDFFPPQVRVGRVVELLVCQFGFVPGSLKRQTHQREKQTNENLKKKLCFCESFFHLEY